MTGAAVYMEQGPDKGLLWHHGEPYAEQRRIADGTGYIALSGREVVSVSGPDRFDWLNSLTTGRFIGFEKNSSVAALILSPNGHVRHELRAVDDGEQMWVVSGPAQPEPDRNVLAASSPMDPVGGSLAGFLQSMKFRTKVDIAAHPELMAVWAGESLLENFLPPSEAPSIQAPFGKGTLRLVEAQRMPTDTENAVGVWAWEAMRIAAGIPRIGIDTDDHTLPNELGLYATALDKGCYTGQETVARVHNVGRPPRRLVRLLLDGSMNRLPAPGARVTLDGESVGRMGSSALHGDDGPIGLALVKRSIPIAATLVIDDVAANQEVIVDPEIGLHVRPDPALRRNR